MNKRIDLAKRFGHNADTYISLGINAKANEFQAAMGLSNLKYIDEIIESRKTVSAEYSKQLAGKYKMPSINPLCGYNYAYLPIIFESEEELLMAVAKLKEHDIFPRRYFYPSLNTLPYLKQDQACPTSEDIAKRVLCLPLYKGLKTKEVDMICKLLK